MSNKDFIIPVIAPTCRRFEKYCDGLLELMGATWPEHPAVWFVSDGKGIDKRHLICVESDSWVERLYRAVKLMQKRLPGMKHVFIILEEKFPLYRCDHRKLVEVQDAAIRYGINCVAFNSTVSSWEEVFFGKTRFKAVPKNYYYYSQNSTGIWRTDHLLETCRHAMKKGLHSGWEFERIISSGHYESDYFWPNLVGGLFQRGWVNPEALKLIQAPEGQRLKSMLTDEYLRQQLGSEFARKKHREEMGDMVFVLKAAGDRRRLGILEQLREMPATFELIQLRQKLSRRRLSRELEVLLSSRMVVELREPGMIRYALNPAPDENSFYSNMLDIVKQGLLALS